MKIDVKTGVITGLLGGFVVSMFGGWSVALLGVLMGVVIGLSNGSKANRKKGFVKLALESLPTAGVAAFVFIAVSLFQNYVLAPAAGRQPSPMNITLWANVAGALGLLLLTAIVTGLHGRPKREEQIGKFIILALLVLIFPFFDKASGLRWSAQFIFALIFVILGLGLNIVVGFAGLLDLGYAAFFAIGAYTTGILSSPQHNIYLNFWLVIWLAAGVAAIWGFILGAPTLPLRGDYLAIVTLGFGEIIPVVFRNLTSVTIKEPLTCWIIPGIQKLFGVVNTVSCYTLPWFGGVPFVGIDLSAGEKGIKPIGRPLLPIIAQNEPMSASLIMKIAIMLIAVALIAFLYVRAWKELKNKTGILIGFVGILVVIAFIFLPVPRPEGNFINPAISKFINDALDVLQPGEFQSDNPIPWYFLIIAIILLSVFLIQRLRDSRLGRAWMAIREDELAAAQMGIDPVRTKLLAFAMGATFSGFAGAFYAAYIRGIFPSVFDFSASIIILCVVILGGIGNINGVIVGGLIIMTADRLFLPALKDLLSGLMNTTILPSLASNPGLQAAVAQNANPILYRFLLFGLTLVIMMAIRPEGIIPSAQRRAELHADEEVEVPVSKIAETEAAEAAKVAKA